MLNQLPSWLLQHDDGVIGDFDAVEQADSRCQEYFGQSAYDLVMERARRADELKLEELHRATQPNPA